MRRCLLPAAHPPSFFHHHHHHHHHLPPPRQQLDSTRLGLGIFSRLTTCNNIPVIKKTRNTALTHFTSPGASKFSLSACVALARVVGRPHARFAAAVVADDGANYVVTKDATVHKTPAESNAICQIIRSAARSASSRLVSRQRHRPLRESSKCLFPVPPLLYGVAVQLPVALDAI
jgi:hypothetical protein